MQAVLKPHFVGMDDYLAGEEASKVKHEYLGGVVYAMSGGSVEHNQIAGNTYSALRSHLRGNPCRVFMADVKIHIEVAGEDLFCYPDIMVGCDPRDSHRLFLSYLRILAEVRSDSTERVDRYEKRVNYPNPALSKVYP